MTIKTHTYSGRTDDKNKKERLHQVVKNYDGESGKDVIVGFMSDAGVQRNKGRIGASGGPEKIRDKMASLPYTNELYDYGSLVGTDNLERSQQKLGEIVTSLLQKNNFPLILGGGHETLYGHYLGIRNRFKSERIAVLNIDAHFDLREERPSSGTMFHQILSEDKNTDYFVLGIQPLGNTETLYETADKFNVKYHTIDEYRENDALLDTLKTELEDYDRVFMTLCFDSIQASVAPGVSAPSPNGFLAYEVKNIIEYFAKLKNLTSFDISEVNPLLDIDDRTSALAAFLAVTFLNHKNKN